MNNNNGIGADGGSNAVNSQGNIYNNNNRQAASTATSNSRCCDLSLCSNSTTPSKSRKKLLSASSGELRNVTINQIIKGDFAVDIADQNRRKEELSTKRFNDNMNIEKLKMKAMTTWNEFQEKTGNGIPEIDFKIPDDLDEIVSKDLADLIGTQSIEAIKAISVAKANNNINNGGSNSRVTALSSVTNAGNKKKTTQPMELVTREETSGDFYTKHKQNTAIADGNQYIRDKQDQAGVSNMYANNNNNMEPPFMDQADILGFTNTGNEDSETSTISNVEGLGSRTISLSNFNAFTAFDNVSGIISNRSMPNLMHSYSQDIMAGSNGIMNKMVASTIEGGTASINVGRFDDVTGFNFPMNSNEDGNLEQQNSRAINNIGKFINLTTGQQLEGDRIGSNIRNNDQMALTNPGSPIEEDDDDINFGFVPEQDYSTPPGNDDQHIDFFNSYNTTIPDNDNDMTQANENSNEIKNRARASEINIGGDASIDLLGVDQLVSGFTSMVGHGTSAIPRMDYDTAGLGSKNSQESIGFNNNSSQRRDTDSIAALSNTTDMSTLSLIQSVGSKSVLSNVESLSQIIPSSLYPTSQSQDPNKFGSNFGNGKQDENIENDEYSDIYGGHSLFFGSEPAGNNPFGTENQNQCDDVYGLNSASSQHKYKTEKCINGSLNSRRNIRREDLRKELMLKIEAGIVSPSELYNLRGYNTMSNSWSIYETERFYGLLCKFGTDFRFISVFLPSKSQKCIKTMYKRQLERCPLLVKKCILYSRLKFDHNAYRLAYIKIKRYNEYKRSVLLKKFETGQ